ncbi:MAG: hypothetical protein LUF01_02320 [Bacteroides sp.]|nr:hypothetical protein [Bacteroides sp.]
MFTLWGIAQKRKILPQCIIDFIEPRWHPYAVRLRAFHLKLMRGKQAPPQQRGALHLPQLRHDLCR